ncbi:MAG: hypoxanthine phosphoribosyltransferase [Lachnospiraceae bacterium]|jgi:hypoxanthine phosphoribosyltransferase
MGSVEVLIGEAEIRNRIKELAAALSENYKDEEVLLIGILNGAVFFLTALAQEMTVPVEIDFMAASSYGASLESSGNVIITKDLERPLKNKHVIIAEDILDTGRTLKLITEMIKEQEPASLEVVTLLDKPDRRAVDFQADYVGFQIPDVFVVGWGLDFDQKYRDLTFVGVYKE